MAVRLVGMWRKSPPRPWSALDPLDACSVFRGGRVCVLRAYSCLRKKKEGASIMSSTFHLVMSCVSRWCGRISRRPWRAPAKFHVRAAIRRPIIYIFFLRFTDFLFLAPVFAAVFLPPVVAALRFLAIDITSFLDKILQHYSDLSKKICELCVMFTLGSRRATAGMRMMHASFLER